MTEKAPLNMSYDEAQDVVTIAGQQFTGEFFRAFGVVQSEGRVVVALFRDADDVVRIERLHGKSLADVVAFVNG